MRHEGTTRGEGGGKALGEVESQVGTRRCGQAKRRPAKETESTKATRERPMSNAIQSTTSTPVSTIPSQDPRPMPRTNFVKKAEGERRKAQEGCRQRVAECLSGTESVDKGHGGNGRLEMWVSRVEVRASPTPTACSGPLICTLV